MADASLCSGLPLPPCLMPNQVDRDHELIRPQFGASLTDTTAASISSFVLLQKGK